MNRGTQVCGIIIAILLVTLLLNGQGGHKAIASPPSGVRVELTEGFYRALQEEGQKNTTKYYGTGKDEEYLRQIAVSAKYTVETNLKIIEQQERMIQLLERIAGKNN